MKLASPAALAALLLTVLPLFSQEAAVDPKPVYLDPTSVSLAFLGNPPADGSPETKAEIETILKLQASRTPDEVARAASEADLHPDAFAGVLGAWFTKENVPATMALLKSVKDDVKLVAKQGKQLWNRPRPPLQDARVQPCADLPKTASYPSGHSTLGTTWALVLAQIVPDKQTDLLARGRQIGDDRVLAGVHFPSDVEAGRKLGAAIVKQLLASPAFQADLAKAKAEVATARTRTPVAATK